MRPIEEQLVLITGASSGLGRYVAHELAASGAGVIVHGRNRQRVLDACAEIREETGNDGVSPVVGDFASLAEVDQVAEAVLTEHDRLHAVVNNAGIGQGAPDEPRGLSRDGFESRLAVNYLAGFHLTRRLLPRLRASAPARIVNVSSAGQAPVDFADPNMERDYDGSTAYRRSKLAQIMFTLDLARELAGTGVTCNALHPATLMDTTMVRTAGAPALTSVEEGGRATLRLLISPELDEVTGGYFNGTAEGVPLSQARDPAARARLRELSEDWVRRTLAASGAETG